MFAEGAAADLLAVDGNPFMTSASSRPKGGTSRSS